MFYTLLSHCIYSTLSWWLTNTSDFQLVTGNLRVHTIPQNHSVTIVSSLLGQYSIKTAPKKLFLLHYGKSCVLCLQPLGVISHWNSNRNNGKTPERAGRKKPASAFFVFWMQYGHESIDIQMPLSVFYLVMRKDEKIIFIIIKKCVSGVARGMERGNKFQRRYIQTSNVWLHCDSTKFTLTHDLSE